MKLSVNWRSNHNSPELDTTLLKLAVTRPLRAIADLVAVESVSHDIVEQALAEGRQRGLLSVREVAELRRQENLPKWFDELLAASKR